MEGRQIRVGGKYILVKRIGGGSFGEIYQGFNNETNDEVAVKLENSNNKFPQLLSEARLIRQLSGNSGIPSVHYFGTEGNFNIMVMELLGPSIEDCFNRCSRRLSLKTIAQVTIQMIQRIECIHEHNIIHRDIKPDNFLTGRNKKAHLVYLIDFGLSKKYRDSKTHQHIPFRENRSLTGTARYVSINCHMGLEQSRRDDLEAIAYVALYLVKGTLPWQGVQATTKQEKYHKIMDKKMNTALDVICRGCPVEFMNFISYSRSLRFEDKPDYNYIKNLFKELIKKENQELDNIFDWSEPKARPALVSSAAVVETEPAKKRKKKRKKTAKRAPSEDSSRSVPSPMEVSVIVNAVEKSDELDESLERSATVEIKDHWPAFQNREKIMKGLSDMNIEVQKGYNNNVTTCILF